MTYQEALNIEAARERRPSRSEAEYMAYREALRVIRAWERSHDIDDGGVAFERSAAANEIKGW